MTILEHLESILGKCTSLLEHTVAVDVRLWADAQSPGMGVACTVGMSNQVQQLPKGQTCPKTARRGGRTGP